MFSLLNKITGKVGSVVFIGALCWMGWQYLGPVKPAVSEPRKQAAVGAMPQVLEDLRANRGDIKTLRLVHLDGDPSDFITTTLRDKLDLSGLFTLDDRSLRTKLEMLLNLPVPSAASLDQALAQAAGSKAQAVLFGTVNRFEEGRDGAVLDMELALATRPEGRVVWTQRYNNRERAGMPLAVRAAEAAPAGGGPFLLRLMGWLVFALLLPVFSVQFLRTMLRRQDNRVTAAMLALYTGVDALMAVLFLTGLPASWAGAAALLIPCAAAFLYNARIMSHLMKLEQIA